MISPWISQLNWGIAMRFKHVYLIFITVILCVTLLINEIILSLNYRTINKEPYTIREYIIVQTDNVEHNGITEKDYIVNTIGCKIPNVDPMDISITQYIRPLSPLVCNYTHPITYTDGLFLRINKSALNTYYPTKLNYCEYQELYRLTGEMSDNLFRYNRSLVQFSKDIKVSCEFLRLACYDIEGYMMYTNFHAFIQPLRNKKNSDLLNMNTNSPSILMIGLDSVSRLNLIRNMKETRHFLLDTMKAFDLQGYNKVADNTLVNLAPMLAGKYLYDLPWNEFINESSSFDKYNFIWKQYQNSEYTTLFAEDAPEIAIFNYMKEGFYEQPADYYLRPYSLAIEKHGSLWNNNHDCFRDTPETKIVLDWSKDFLLRYRSNPYFAFLFLTRLTHEDINKAALADVLYKDYFESLYESGLLDNTIVLFFSDHGMRFGPVRQSHIGKLEERLPFFLISLPSKYRQTLSETKIDNLNINQYRLTTPFDIYETLVDMLPGHMDSMARKNQKHGQSLFSVISPERNCDSAGIEPHWCACHQRKQVNTMDPIIVNASLFIVDYINKKLSPVSEYCEFLNLESIEDALFIWNSNALNKNDTSQWLMQEYLITVTVAPGNGVFETTLRHDWSKTNSKHVYQILGEPSRISRYGDNGKCIKQHSLQKYCFCREYSR